MAPDNTPHPTGASNQEAPSANASPAALTSIAAAASTASVAQESPATPIASGSPTSPAAPAAPTASQVGARQAKSHLLSSAATRFVLGKACLQAWLFIMLFSPVIRGTSMSDVEQLGNVTMAWCLGFVAASLLGALPWNRLRTSLLAPTQVPSDFSQSTASPHTCVPNPLRIAMVISGIALCTCTLMLEGSGLVGGGAWIQAFFSVLAGAGSAVQCWGWGLLLTTSYSRLSGVCVGAAFACAAGIFIFAASVPTPLALALTALLPIVDIALFLSWKLSPLASRTSAQAADAAFGNPSQKGSLSPLAQRSPSRQPVIFARALVGVVLLGFSESFSRTLFQEPGAVADPAYPWALLLATVAAAALVSLVSLARLERDSIGRVNHVLMLAMALVLALMPALQGLGLATDTANLVCRIMFYLIIEVLFAQVSFIHGLNARVSYALGFGLANTGCLVGILLGKQLVPFVANGFPEAFRLQVVLAVLCAVLVFAAFLFVVDERTFVELLHAEEPGRPQARRFVLRCDHIAQQFGLSAKQTEVMVLAAKGNTSQRIAETLGISVGTVNVHLNHVYRKLEVHSRQEMLDLIEKRD